MQENEANGSVDVKPIARRIADQTATAEAELRDRLVEAVRSQPLVAVGAACAVGAVLGGLVFSKVGRLVFLGVAGYVANELWRNEGHIEIDRLIGKIAAPLRSAHNQHGDR